MNQLQRKVYEIIRDDDENGIAGNVFDGIIITLIVINTVQVILDTFSLPPVMVQISQIVEYVSIIIFTIEYLLRLWTAPLIYKDMTSIKACIKHSTSFMAVIDLLAILPFYIPFIIPVDLRVLRSLRIIRLLRLFKVNRYTSALYAIGSVLRRKSSQLLSSVFIVLLLMIISAVLMFNVENAAQPDKFTNAFDSMWWAVATFTTVGYGDIYPITIVGRILSGVIAILGIGLVAVPTGIISSGFIEEMETAATKDEKPYCPYCGHSLTE